MKWAEDNATALIAAGVGFLSALGAGVRILWGRLVESQTAKIAALELELRQERKEHWRTAMALERLSGKYELERVSSSRPPPSS